MRRRTLKLEHLRAQEPSENVVRSGNARKVAAEAARLSEEDARRARAAALRGQNAPPEPRAPSPQIKARILDRPSFLDGVREKDVVISPQTIVRRRSSPRNPPPRRAQDGMEQPEVAVIVPVYNSAYYFGTSILSLLEQTHPISELIVVDDGSTDGLASTFGKSSRYHFIRQPHGNGNVARNRGVAMSKSDFLLFADSDCIYDPRMIEVYLRELRKNQNAAYAYCPFGLHQIESGHASEHQSAPFNDEALYRMNYISMISLIRRSRFTGFDEKLLRYQDWDLWLSMLQNGDRGHFVKKKLFTSIQRPGCVSRSGNRDQLVAEMRARYRRAKKPIRETSVFLNCNHGKGLIGVEPDGPRVSVILPTYGNVEMVRTSIDHLVAGHDPGFLQIVVVDNGVEDALTDYLYNHPGILVVRNPMKEGYARSVNRGFRLTSAACVAVQRPDIMVPKGHYHRAYERFKAYGHPGLLGGVHNKLRTKWERRIDVPPIRDFRYREDMGVVDVMKDVIGGTRGLNEISSKHEKKAIPGFATEYGVDESFFITSHEAFCHLGGLDETLEGAEGLDFGIRCKEEGLSVMVDPSLFAFCLSERPIKSSATQVYFYRKHPKPEVRTLLRSVSL